MGIPKLFENFECNKDWKPPYSSITKEYNLCENSILKNFAQSNFFLGQGISMVVFPYLSNIRGRK
jgi:MFS family permease